MSGFMMNVGGLSSGLSTVAGAIPSAGESNMHIACGDLQGEIRDRAPVDTGHLRGSYDYSVKSSGDTVVGHVGTNVEYAAYQEHLYTPHVRPAVEARRSNLVKIMAADTLTEAVSHAR